MLKLNSQFDKCSHRARPVFCKAPCGVANSWGERNRHVITLVNHDWLILLKQDCNLVGTLFITLFWLLWFLKTLAQGTERCNSVLCQQEERSHTTALWACCL